MLYDSGLPRHAALRGLLALAKVPSLSAALFQERIVHLVVRLAHTEPIAQVCEQIVKEACAQSDDGMALSSLFAVRTRTVAGAAKITTPIGLVIAKRLAALDGEVNKRDLRAGQ